LLPAEAHGAAQVRVLTAQLVAAIGALPFGNQRDNRVLGTLLEFR
jgi:hypothetical protein